MMKIALVSPGSFTIPSEGSSSVEHVMRELAIQLAKHTACTIYGIKSKGLRVREYREGVRYIRPSGRKGYRSAVIRSLRRERYDLIQIDNRPRIARAVKRALPTRTVVLALHSLTFVSGRHISRQELASCFRHVDYIIVNSRFVQEEIGRLVPEASHKLHVIHPGVETERFTSRWTECGQASREEVLKRMGYSGKKIILYMGRLRRIKGVHYLLQAMQQIVREAPDAVLVIVGGAFYGSSRTTAYVRELYRLGKKLGDHVRFVPYVPRSSVPGWLLLADLVVVPSPRREAFGLVNVEAMAAGIPVLAAAAGGMTEIIEHERTGLLLDAHELPAGIAHAAIRLLQDRAWLQGMGEMAALRVRQRFTWEAAADSWLKLASGQR